MKLTERVLENMESTNMDSQVLPPDPFIQSLELSPEVPTLDVEV
jgi:hypothetical protein